MKSKAPAKNSSVLCPIETGQETIGKCSNMAKVTSDVELTKVKPAVSHYGGLLGKMGNEVEKYNLKLSLEHPVTGEPMSTTIKEWYDDLHTHLRVVSKPPKVTKTTLQDARKLFGANFDTNLTLRKAEHLGADEDIILVQLDPNFTATKVVCRHPSCNITNPEAATIGQKRDLYLCPRHRQGLRDSICDALAKKNISMPTSTQMPDPGRFAGYTSLISLLEGAYNDAKKFGTLKGKSPMVEEAILNAKNFLIITSTVLNPNGNNLEVVLPPIYYTLRLILEQRESISLLVDDIVYVLREVIEMILFAFGVVYRWVSLALQSPGAQIGAGLGGLICGGAGLVFGPWAGAAGMAAGGILGGLIGNGIYNLVAGDPRQQEIERFRRDWAAVGGAGPTGQPNNQFPVYYFDGNAFGGLYLHPFPGAQ